MQQCHTHRHWPQQLAYANELLLLLLCAAGLPYKASGCRDLTANCLQCWCCVCDSSAICGCGFDIITCTTCSKQKELTLSTCVYICLYLEHTSLWQTTKDTRISSTRKPDLYSGTMLQEVNNIKHIPSTSTRAPVLSPVAMQEASHRVVRRYRKAQLRRIQRKEYLKLRAIVPAVACQGKVSKVGWCLISSCVVAMFVHWLLHGTAVARYYNDMAGAYRRHLVCITHGACCTEPLGNEENVNFAPFLILL